MAERTWSNIICSLNTKSVISIWLQIGNSENGHTRIYALWYSNPWAGIFRFLNGVIPTKRICLKHIKKKNYSFIERGRGQYECMIRYTGSTSKHISGYVLI